jgi:ligand-binding sensor domain-containing protein
MLAPTTRPGHPARLTAAALTLLLFAAAAAPAAAQDITFEQLLVAREVSALEEADGRLIVGLTGGGVMVLPVDDPSATAVRWNSGDGMVGNSVTDLYWSGRSLMIATSDGGMTRVTDLAGAANARPFTTNIASLHVTSVSGEIVGGSERIWYGTAGAGIGVINDGIAGSIYSAEQDGLLSDDVQAVQVLDGAVFVATPLGVSRFFDNFATDASAGLADPDVRCLAVDGNGVLLAGNSAGVHSWDPDTGTWSLEWATSVAIGALSAAGDEVYALGVRPAGVEALWVRQAGNWRGVTLPEQQCYAIHAGDSFWIGGERSTESDLGSRRDGYVGRLREAGGFDTWSLNAPLPQNVEGVTIGADGRVWLGDWSGRSVAVYDGESWENIWEEAGAENDSLGLFPCCNVLSMATGPDGAVYIGQYAFGGVIRVDPVTGDFDHIERANSGLEGEFIINLATHPDGALIVMHDAGDVEKVEVLFDPAAWRDPASWITLPRDGGLGSGESVWDAVAERRDVVWFAVRDVGLVRWDINGDAAGPDDELTWADTSDDRWDAPVRSWPGTTFDPAQVFGLAVGPDGTLWAGGNGLVQFSYDEDTQAVTTLTIVGEKFASSVEGLVNANVADVAVDAEGGVWVVTPTGVNRVDGAGREFTVQAWIDLPNYYGNPLYPVLYSSNVIAPLPGTFYRKIVADASGRKLLLSGDQGASLVTVGSGGSTSPDATALDAVYCYPNPWTPDAAAGTDGWLKLGGIAADEPVDVEIYSLTGDRLLSLTDVAPGEGFWDGTNAADRRVASGMYVLRITRGESIVLRTLAVVR